MALNFAAVTQMIQLPDSISAVRNVPGATLCGWVKLTSKAASNGQVLISLTRNGSRAFSRCRISAVGQGGTYLRGSGQALDADGNSFFESTTLSLTIGQWGFIAGTFDYVNRRIRLFLNNSSQQSGVLGWTAGNCSNTTTLANTVGNWDGASGNDIPLFGSAEDVRIYNRVLSIEELLTIYSCNGSDGIFLGLQARYIFNDRAVGYAMVGGDTVKDLEGNYLGTATAGSIYSDSQLKPLRQYQ